MTATTTPTATPTATSSTPASAGNAGGLSGTESSLSNWAGPYVTDMLGKAQALGNTPYPGYTGALTAGPSTGQQQAFSGIAGLTLPSATQMQAFTPTQWSPQDATRLMNPYMEGVVNPQMEEATRQAQIQNLTNRANATKAGAYGGGRQALMDTENQRSLQATLSGIYGTGYKNAYDQALAQFNAEQQQGLNATQATQNYGINALKSQLEAGMAQRAIEQEGLTADKAQWTEEQQYPYKQLQFLQSLMQGLPVGTTSYSYTQPSALSQALGTAGSVADLYTKLFPGTTPTTNQTGSTTSTA